MGGTNGMRTIGWKEKGLRSGGNGGGFVGSAGHRKCMLRSCQ
jgi:hypothetical protein